jgi:hypothetical protein
VRIGCESYLLHRNPLAFGVCLVSISAGHTEQKRRSLDVLMYLVEYTRFDELIAICLDHEYGAINLLQFC